jgi:hypothetical protein
LLPAENLEALTKKVRPENSLPSRLLREEMDGVLLLCRTGKRVYPVAGESSVCEERGGECIMPSKDRVICVNRGWCEVFGFVDETADLHDQDIEKSLQTAGVPLDEMMHPLYDTARTVTVWSKKKGVWRTCLNSPPNLASARLCCALIMVPFHSLCVCCPGHITLSFKSFHIFSLQLHDTFQEVLAFSFTDVTVQQRVEQALLLAHQQSRRSEQAKQHMIAMVSHEVHLQRSVTQSSDD